MSDMAESGGINTTITTTDQLDTRVSRSPTPGHYLIQLSELDDCVEIEMNANAAQRLAAQISTQINTDRQLALDQLKQWIGTHE